MPKTNKLTCRAFQASGSTRNTEGHLLLKDGSLDGRSLRARHDRRFMVRVEAAFPQEVKLIAARTGKTMGQVVQEAVRAHFSPKRKSRGHDPV